MESFYRDAKIFLSLVGKHTSDDPKRRILNCMICFCFKVDIKSGFKVYVWTQNADIVFSMSKPNWIEYKTFCDIRWKKNDEENDAPTSFSSCLCASITRHTIATQAPLCLCLCHTIANNVTWAVNFCHFLDDVFQSKMKSCQWRLIEKGVHPSCRIKMPVYIFFM